MQACACGAGPEACAQALTMTTTATATITTTATVAATGIVTLTPPRTLTLTLALPLTPSLTQTLTPSLTLSCGEEPERDGHCVHRGPRVEGAAPPGPGPGRGAGGGGRGLEGQGMIRGARAPRGQGECAVTLGCSPPSYRLPSLPPALYRRWPTGTMRGMAPPSCSPQRRACLADAPR